MTPVGGCFPMLKCTHLLGCWVLVSLCGVLHWVLYCQCDVWSRLPEKLHGIFFLHCDSMQPLLFSLTLEQAVPFVWGIYFGLKAWWGEPPSHLWYENSLSEEGMTLLSVHYFLLLVSDGLYFALWSPSNTCHLSSSEAGAALCHRGIECWPEIHRHYPRSATKPLWDWLLCTSILSNKWVFSFFWCVATSDCTLSKTVTITVVNILHSTAQWGWTLWNLPAGFYIRNQGHNCWTRTEIGATPEFFLEKRAPKILDSKEFSEFGFSHSFLFPKGSLKATRNLGIPTRFCYQECCATTVDK